MTVSVEDALKGGRSLLREAGMETPELESEFLMAALLGQTRAEVLLRRREPMKEETRLRFNEWVLQRRSRKPLAYVTGEQPFFGKSFVVTTDVLVPRPETELLVAEAMRCLSQNEGPASLVDVGTGCGVIAVILAGHPRVQRAIGVDLSAEALKVAAANARAQGAAECHWKQGDLLAALREDEAFDLIVANLPYVRQCDLRGLSPEVHWEPRLALDGGVDGLDLIRRLIKQAPAFLKEKGILLLEIGADQGKAVSSILKNDKRWTDVAVLPDLAGHDRIVRAGKRN
jgi:release factor glutamine methyltransferase